MRITIFKCDQCGAILSDETQGIAKEHLHLQMSQSGFAKASESHNWSVKGQKFFNGFKQFCNEKCLVKYIEASRKQLKKDDDRKTDRETRGNFFGL